MKERILTAAKKKMGRPQLSDVVMAQSEELLQQRRGGNKVNSSKNNGSSSIIGSESSSDTSVTSVSSSSSSKSATSSSSSSRPSLWYIHGKGYDLEEFVDRHPGGVEAILLGKGRDCTALVESYHPFSTLHWKVLEKYVVEGNDDDDAGDVGDNPQQRLQQQQQQSTAERDFFYEILKQRVASVLQAKGIDPREDRGATWTRNVCYCTVFASWIYTGYLHLSVRVS